MKEEREHTAVVTLVTGELLTGRRAHELPASTDPIQNCWKVAWAETDAMKATEAVRAARRCIYNNEI